MTPKPLPVGLRVSFYIDLDMLHIRPGNVRRGTILEVLRTDDGPGGPHYRVQLDNWEPDYWFHAEPAVAVPEVTT